MHLSVHALKSSYRCMVVVVLVAHSCPTLCDPMDYSPPGSSVHGILQTYWNELPFLPPGDLPDPGMEPGSLALRQILSLLSHKGRPNDYTMDI